MYICIYQYILIDLLLHSVNVLSSLKAQPKERRQYLSYLRISKSITMKCLVVAHANYLLSIIPSLKKYSLY